MNRAKVSRYHLDRVLLGLGSAEGLSPEDRARLEAHRKVDATRQRASAPEWLSGLERSVAASKRSWFGELRAFAWMLAPTAAFTLLVALPFDWNHGGERAGTRAKGSSRVDLVIRRDDQVFAFDGRALRPSDTLVFRYSSEKRFLVLAGREDGGEVTVYASLPVEPGHGRVAETGVRLDDYRGGEWFFALLSERALDPNEALTALEGNGDQHGGEVELFRWRVEREPR